MTPRHFIHSGDLGDVIYALPTVRAFGGGTIHLVNQNVGQLHGMSRERAMILAPLLMAQPYVHAVRYDLPTEGEWKQGGVNLNAFRFSGQDFFRQHLADCVARTFGLPGGIAEEPWLTVQPCQWGPVFFARSARYHNPNFPWRKVIEKYGQHARFVGTPAEHVAFNTEFEASVPYLATDNLETLAAVLNMARLFVGNQSAPLAIAEGLGINILCEECPACPNCHLNRHNFYTNELPDLEGLWRNTLYSRQSNVPASSIVI